MQSLRSSTQSWQQPDTSREGSAPSLVFREITSAAELTQLFRLRHTVYAAQGYWAADPRALDTDSYDRHSRFIGAWTERGELVGGARLILPEGEPHAAYFDALGADAPAPRQGRYHSDKLFDFGAVLEFADRQRQTMVEFGRTVMHPDWQRSGLGTSLVHALYGLALRYGVRYGLAAVPPRLTRFYQALGCRLLQHAGSARAAGIDTDLVPLTVDLQRLDGPLRVSLQVARGLRRTGSWSPEIKVAAPAAPAPQTAAAYSWEPPASLFPLLQARAGLMECSLADGARPLTAAGVEELAQRALALGVGQLHLGPAAGAAAAADLIARPGRRLELTCSARLEGREIAAAGQLRRGGLLRLELQGEFATPWSAWRRCLNEASLLGLETTVCLTDGLERSPEEWAAWCHGLRAHLPDVQRVTLCDARGAATPHTTRVVCELLQRAGLQVGWRGSRQGGLALANALVAWECGATPHAGRGVGAELALLLRHLQTLAARPLDREALLAYEGEPSRSPVRNEEPVAVRAAS